MRIISSARLVVSGKNRDLEASPQGPVMGDGDIGTPAAISRPNVSGITAPGGTSPLAAR